MPFRARYLIGAILLFMLSACQQPEPVQEAPRELLIYCGITMVQPVREIADLVEERERCVIKITKNGSGELYHSIQVNQVGDLYLPGSESYMRTSLEEGLVDQTVVLGANRAALVVAKGNPLDIAPDIHEMLNPTLRVVIGSAESGSIGRETKRILEKAGFYREVLARSLYVTSDSKGLKNAIRDDRADLVINWLATTTWSENAPYMDALPLDEKVAPPHRLIMGRLKTTRHPDIARKFMDLASAPEGQAIFRKYGFGI